MKIQQIDLIAFGPFKNQSLDFSQGPRGLHLIYGPNEAGKSSTLRALVQVLFGIKMQNPDAFRIPYPKLKLGATLENGSGQRLSFLRVKGNKNTLRNLEGKNLADDCLDPFLGHVDREMFTTQFGLNWETLKAGGAEIVRSKGELGRALFAAGSGLTTLTQVQESIQKELNELFLGKGQRPKINEGWQKYQEAEGTLRKFHLSSQMMKEHRDAFEEASQLEKDLTAQRQTLEKNRSRLQRIQNAKRPIQIYRETLRELEGLQHAVVLPKDFSDRHQQVRDQFHNAQHSYEILQADIARVAEQIRSHTVNQAVLDHGPVIDSLYKETEKYLSSVGDYPQVNSNRQAAEEEARQLLQSIRPEFPLENVHELQLLVEDRVLIRELGPDRNVLLERVESAARELQETERQLAQLQMLRENSDEIPDAGALRSAVKRAERRGPLEEDFREKQQEIQQAEHRAILACQQLRFWSGTLEELEKVRVPGRETLKQFQARFDEAAKTLDRLTQQHKSEQAALQENQDEFEKLELEGEVPTEEGLAAARQRREQGWQLVLQCWRDAEESPSDLKPFLSEIDAPDLATGFQKAIDMADAVSDQLRLQAAQVSEKKRLIASRKRIQENLPLLDDQITECQRARKTLEEDWRKEWLSLGIEAGSPAEMREWLQSHMELMTPVKNLHVQKLALQSKAELIQEHRAQLISCLETVSPATENVSKHTLLELLEKSQNVLEEITERQTRQARFEEDIQKLKHNLPNLKQGFQTAKTKFSDWERQWADLMKKLGLPPKATPTQANAILDTLDRLFERVRDEANDAHRVRAMREFNELFEARVKAVGHSLQWKADDSTPTQLVTKWHALLTRSREAAHKLRDLEKERVGQLQALQQRERQIEFFQVELQQMCQVARCSCPAELPRAEKESVRKAQLEQTLHEAREQILQFAAESTFEDFLKQAAAEDTDALGGQLTDVARHIEQVESEMAVQMKRAIHAQNELERHSGNSRAAEANEEKQSLLAELRGHLERYVQLRLAAEVLQQGAERYRKKDQGSILNRASDLFRQLTCDSFVQLRNEADDQGKPHVVGVRLYDDTEEVVEVAGMSDGTADQLYLALRIAILEDWLTHHPPIPFVVDDILINFDDQRAIAALKVLAKLSERTQVIYFTHHKHLVELAKANLPHKQCFTHHLLETKSHTEKKPHPINDTGTATLF